MKITENMSIQELAERMGTEATKEQAKQMLTLLLAAGLEGVDTRDVPEPVWSRLLDNVN